MAKMKSMAEFGRIFNDSDVDKNKLLNLEEFILFCATYTAVKKARGEKEIKKPQYQKEQYFEAYNKITPDQPGLSIWDLAVGIHFGREVFGQKLQEGWEDQQLLKNENSSEQSNTHNNNEENPDIDIFDLTDPS